MTRMKKAVALALALSMFALPAFAQDSVFERYSSDSFGSDSGWDTAPNTGFDADSDIYRLSESDTSAATLSNMGATMDMPADMFADEGSEGSEGSEDTDTNIFSGIEPEKDEPAAAAGPSPFDKRQRKTKASGGSSIDMSYGVSLYFLGDFGGGATFSGSAVQVLQYDTYVTPVYGIGISPFFDAQYVEASLGLFLGGGRWEATLNGKYVPNTADDNLDFDAVIFSLNIDVLGKYPIPFLGKDNMRIFPLVGIAYHLSVWGRGTYIYEHSGIEVVTKFDGEECDISAADLSALWFKFGVGGDYDINDSMYLRGSLLYGFRLSNGYEDNIILGIDENRKGGTLRLGHGLTIKVGVGINM